MKKFNLIYARNMFKTAWQTLEFNKDLLNKINVFPEDDGDTGKNMAGTFAGAMEYLNFLTDDTEYEEFAGALDKGLVVSSKGNSGSLIVCGLKAALSTLMYQDEFTGSLFAKAVRNASNAMYKSMEKPMPGTIITVLSDVASSLEAVEDTNTDILTLAEIATKSAFRSVDNTPNLLPELKAAGVVDSGSLGAGFIFESIEKFIKGDNSLDSRYQKFDNIRPKIAITKHGHKLKGKYRYCTQVLFKSKRHVDEEKLKVALRKFCDSEILNRSGNIFMLHAHTNNPDHIKKLISRKYLLVDFNFDDMWLQSTKRLELLMPKDLEAENVAIITDATADLTPEEVGEFNLIVVPMSVTVCDIELNHQPGWPEMAAEEYYDLLIQGQLEDKKPFTVSVSEESWRQPAKECLEAGMDVIFMPFSRAVSGTFENASRAAKQLSAEYPYRKITCIDTATGSRGLAHLVIGARKKLWANERYETVVEWVEQEKLRIHIYIVIDNIEFLLQGGRLKKSQETFLNLSDRRPVITINTGGAIDHAGTVSRGKLEKSLVDLMRGVADRKNGVTPICTLFTSNEHIGQTIADAMAREFGEPDATIPAFQVGPVIGAHLGPGRNTVAFLVIGKSRK